ncbi:MAG: flagellar biosynthetic protein FliR [Phycisphaerales bacterium]
MSELLNHLLPFMLATFRVAGAMILAPLVGGTTIPAQARVLIAFALAAAMYPAVAPAASGAALPVAQDHDVFSIGVAVAGETLIGFSIGLLMMMPVAAVQLAGLLMGQQMGFGLAQVYNPSLDIDTDMLGDLLGYIALGAFITIGGLEGTFIAVARTFESIPLASSGVVMAPVDLLVNLLGSGFDLATRVSLPLMGIILIETVAMALLTKTLPQANIMSIGFAIKILLGFAAILAGLGAGTTAISDHVSETARLVLQWAGAAGGQGT